MRNTRLATILLLGALTSCVPLPTISELEDAAVDRAPPGDSPPEVSLPDTGPPTDTALDRAQTDATPLADTARDSSPFPDSSASDRAPSAEDVLPDRPPGSCTSSADCSDLAPWRCTSSGTASPGTCACTPAPVAAPSVAECARQDTDCDGHPDPLTYCTTPTGPRCVDLRADTANCGRCGVACRTGETCTAGVCVCPGADTGAGRACSNGCFAFPDNASRCLYCARYCVGAGAHPDCCPWACAVTTACGR